MAGSGRTGRCVNIGNCTLADGGKPIEVASGTDFVCPECGRGLVVMQAPVPKIPWLPVAAAAAVVALLALGYLFWPRSRPVPGPTPPADVALRLGGSNTIGDKLGPALVEGWLKSRGCGDVARSSPAKDEMILSCSADGKPLTVTVASHGTKTGFAGLKAAKYDLAMASDPIDDKTAADLAPLGPMKSLAAEHIIALDGVAVIVNPANRVPSLTTAQVADLFGGRIMDWQQVGGTPGPVSVFARDENSGTWKFFKRTVLDGYRATLRGDARRFEKGSELADEVATTPGAIGFVGAGSSQVARAVPLVAQRGGDPLVANRFTIATEDYALSRRLYLYLPPNAANVEASRFLAFVGSSAGQQIVETSGFVPRTIVRRDEVKGAGAPLVANAPPDYLRVTSGGDRLSTNFYFDTGKATLDNRALGDIDGVVDYLARNHLTPDRVILIGFTDDRGGDAYNVALSRARAEAVRRELATRRIVPGAVTGFGKAMPIRDNYTEEGRAKNRRAEVWVRP